LVDSFAINQKKLPSQERTLKESKDRRLAMLCFAAPTPLLSLCNNSFALNT
jgi:hypothetical protein